MYRLIANYIMEINNMKKVNVIDIQSLLTGIKLSDKEKATLKEMGQSEDGIANLEQPVKSIHLNKEYDFTLTEDKDGKKYITVEYVGEGEAVSFGYPINEEYMNAFEEVIDYYGVVADVINDHLILLYNGEYKDCGEYWDICSN